MVIAKNCNYWIILKGKVVNLVSERKSLSQKLQKIWKKYYKKFFFGNVRVFTDHLEYPENTPVVMGRQLRIAYTMCA